MQREEKLRKIAEQSEEKLSVDHESERRDLVAFEACAQQSRALEGVFTQDEQLMLYALYKTVKKGPPQTSRPSALDMVACAKWDAWKRVSDRYSRGAAAAKYIDAVRSVASASRTRVDGAGDESLLVTAQCMSQPKTAPSICVDIWDFAANGDLEQVRRALDGGLDVDMTEEDGGKLTPLHFACDRGHVEVVELLIARGASVAARDEEGQTPLHYAVFNDFLDVVRVLSKAGADFEARDNEGKTPVEVAEGETARFLGTLGIKLPKK